MLKERIGAIFIGVIMLMSVVGFALVSVIPQAPQAPEIPTIVNGEITSSEVLFYLQNGRTVFRYYYDSEKQDDLDNKIILEVFVNQMKDFTVLNEIEANETKLEIIGAEGRIVDFSDEINNQNLMKNFCKSAIIKPKECLLREI